jgi:hypothetical protein
MRDMVISGFSPVLPGLAPGIQVWSIQRKTWMAAT